MKKYLAEYGKTNPEKFNSILINSKNDRNIIDEIKAIFKSLEVIPSIHVEDVRMETHEEQFGPIRDKSQYYKPVHGTRLQKVHFVIRVDGLENKIEQDLYLLKLLDNNYYINEGTKYFPIWQIVPNFSIHSNNGVIVKPITMPLTIINTATNIASEVYGKAIIDDVNSYEALIFNKAMPILIYYFGKFAMTSYDQERINTFDDVETRNTFKDPTLIDKFNEFFGVNLKFSDDKDSLIEDDRLIFKQENGVAFSIPKHQASTPNGKLVIGMLLYTRNPLLGKTKSKKQQQLLEFNYDSLITPWFWINIIGASFTRGNDIFKRYKKAHSIFISIDRVVDQKARETLPIPDKYRENFYTLTYFICRNFKALMKRDNMDLKTMKLNLFEYILYPLRLKFAHKINSLANQTNVTPDDVYKIFKNMSPMFIIRELVNSGLIHMYESTNDLSLFNMTLKCTFVGPAGGASKNMTLNQRDLQPSFNGRIDLIVASPGNPGATSVIVPFNELVNNQFETKTIPDYDDK